MIFSFINIFPRIRIIHYILELGDSFLLIGSKCCGIPGSNDGTSFISQGIVKNLTIAGS